MRLVVLGALALVTAGASAQDSAGAYLGIGVGQLDYSETVFGFGLEDTSLTYKMYGGYRFNDNWAFEAGWGQTESLEWSESGVYPGLGQATANLSADYDITEVRGIRHFDRLFVGVGYWEAELGGSVSGISQTDGPYQISITDTDTGASGIVGAQWDTGRKGYLRVELEIFDTEDTIDLYHIGFGYHFRFKM